MSEPVTPPDAGAEPAPSPLFADLGFDERIVRAVTDMGFESPTPIQVEAAPHLMAGRDIIGGARTGSGKTAAFGLPLLHRLRDGGRRVRALVLAPTRELARQVSQALDGFARHLPIKILTVYGGVAYKQQLRGLHAGVDVVVGTPGRVLDHISSGALDLSALEVFVLDEADEMLQMGFIEDIERVFEAAPDNRQVALFSATMPKEIRRVAERYLNDPARVQVEEQALSASHVTQRWLKTIRHQKTKALIRVLQAEERDAALVFARTRAGVAELAGELAEAGFSSDALHGDLNQAAREMVLKRLRARQIDVVVATDVAARGLDVNHITHVINFDFPENSETYVHRIGRTARAGRDGWAITFVQRHEQHKLRHLQRDLGQRISQMNMPTDAQIAARHRAALVTELDAAMDASGSERAEAWLTELLDETGWAADDVAAAALSLLALERNFDLRRAIPEAPAKPTYQEQRASQEARFTHNNEVELFFPAGRSDGLRPADLVGALCHQAGMTSGLIGRISLGPNKAFVGLPRQVAEELLNAFTELEVRGRVYRLQLSFDSRSGSRPNSQPHKKRPQSRPQRPPRAPRSPRPQQTSRPPRAQAPHTPPGDDARHDANDALATASPDSAPHPDGERPQKKARATHQRTGERDEKRRSFKPRKKARKKTKKKVSSHKKKQTKGAASPQPPRKKKAHRKGQSRPRP